MSAESAAQAPPPDISIRAKPPSPRRLSRKVLMGGALVMASIIVFALFYGLSERPDRRQASETHSAAASGPPDSIRMAPQNYGAADLGAAEEAQFAESRADMLAAPEGELWRGAQSAPPARAAPAEPDPEANARVAPILFTANEDAPNSAGAAPPTGGRHAAFLNSQRSGDERLQARLIPPRSRYELLAGAIIPAALQTELNSDLPGRVIAQVTAPVFDSVTGRHLLIPQGARLIGAYDSATTYGDRRLLLVWNRLILPNGWSINLQGMDGADASGAAGLRDRVDNHLGQLAGAIALSAVMSVIANEAEGEEELSLTQSIGDAAAQEAARTGARIVDRDLTVKPTLRVRAGAPVRVLVTRDMVLRPYRQ